MNIIKFSSACFVFLSGILPLTAQRQLILLSGDKVVKRFNVLDNFYSVVKGSKKEHWGFLVEIDEYSIITSQDTILLEKIDKVLLPGKPWLNKVGKSLITIGLLYFSIDQFNNSIIQKNDFSVDATVWKPAAIMVGVGAPLLLFRKKWIRCKYPTKLISVDKGSRFYRSE